MSDKYLTIFSLAVLIHLILPYHQSLLCIVSSHLVDHPRQINSQNMPNISVCRQVLVIGATAGLGRALSLAIRDLPSAPRVVVAGRRLERLEQLSKEERVDAVQLDVAAPREKLIESVNDVLKKYPDVSTGSLSHPSQMAETGEAH